MLELFSPNGVENSLIIPVFVGVVISSMFTERYGWVFSGLVVPGYMAPIFVAYPLAGATIVFEAVVTYLIVRLVSSSSWKTRTHTPPFGRERFLAIVIVGIAVRLVVEELIVPVFVTEILGGGLAALAESRQGGAIGLVIVPLLANLMWRPGLYHGLLQFGVGTLAVLGVIQGVLEPLSNFSLSRVEVLYEDIALDFADSAKAQIIIATGCVLAAALNLRHGWDFGGILIPPLLAVSMFQPVQLVATFAETLAIVVVGRGLVKLPGFSRLTLVGPRLTLYLFSLAMALKIAFGWILWFTFPQWTATDYFGFGYLLSTLLAAKVWNKGLRVSFFPTLYTTLATFILGSLIAMGMPALFPAAVAPAPEDRIEMTTETLALEISVLRVIDVPGEQVARTPQGRIDLHRVLAGIGDGLGRGDAADAVARAAVEAAAGTEVIVKRIAVPRTADGGAVGAERGGLEYLVLGPGDAAPGSLETIFVRLRGGDSRTMLIASAGGNRFASSIAAAALARDIAPAIILLGDDEYAESSAAPGSGTTTRWLLDRFPHRPVMEVAGIADGSASLQVFGSLPMGLSVRRLREALPCAIEIPGELAGRRAIGFTKRCRGGFTRLAIGADPAIDLLVAGVRRRGERVDVVMETRPLDTLLDGDDDGALLVPERIPSRGLAESLALKEGLLELIFEIQERTLEGETPDLAGAAYLARTLSLHLRLVEAPSDERRYLVLSGDESGDGIVGLAIFALDEFQDRFLEVPSPWRFPNSFRIATRLLQGGYARVLSVAGIGGAAAGIVAADGSAIANQRTLYHLVHQAVIEDAVTAGRPAPPTLQIRGLTQWRTSENDGVIVPMQTITASGERDDRAVEPWQEVFRELGWDIDVEPFDAPGRHGVDHTLQARYRRLLHMEGVCGLWVNGSVRHGSRGGVVDAPTLAAIADLGFPVREESFARWWEGRELRSVPNVEPELDVAVSAFEEFQRTGNIATLQRVVDAATRHGWTTLVVQDDIADATLLVVRAGAETIVFNASVAPFNGDALDSTVGDFLRLRRSRCFGRSAT